HPRATALPAFAEPTGLQGVLHLEYCTNFGSRMGAGPGVDRYTGSPMPKYRKLLILVLLLAAGTAAFLLYRQAAAAPEAARLLPEGDRVAYVNMKPVRLFWDLRKSKPLELEGSYRDFVAQTGFQFERDLDEIAVSWQETRTTGSRDVESAAVFSGRFDQAKLNAYLKKLSSQEETYRGLTIYTIPNQDHHVRVCVLDKSRVATSTRNSGEVIHG